MTDKQKLVYGVLSGILVILMAIAIYYGLGFQGEVVPGPSPSVALPSPSPSVVLLPRPSATPSPLPQPSLSPIPSPSPKPSPSSTPTRSGINLFSTQAPWHIDVSQAELDPNSTTIMNALQAAGGWGYGALRIDFSLEFLRANSTTPFMNFNPTSEHYSPDCDFDPVPVVPGGNLEGESGYQCLSDGDCHLLVFHEPSSKLYEMWRADITNGVFNGGCLAVWDTNKYYGDLGRGKDCTSADAAGYPIVPMTFTADEVASGEINHAIRFILPNARIRHMVYVAPATHSTSATSGGVNLPPYGVRLRLRPDFDTSGLSAGAKVVAQALKKYGMFLSDGGNIALTALSDRRTTAKWDGLLDAYALTSLKVTDFQVIKMGALNTFTGDCVRRDNQSIPSAVFNPLPSPKPSASPSPRPSASPSPSPRPSTTPSPTPTITPSPVATPLAAISIDEDVNMDITDKFTPVDCTHKGGGRDIQVGPGKQYQTIGAVDWNNLKAGDTVRIFYKPEPYFEKIFIRGHGSKSQPIKICGVPGPNGELPIIDGTNATIRPDVVLSSSYEQYGLVIVQADQYYDQPQNIILEGLEIRNSRQGLNYINKAGVSSPYSEAAACIRIQRGAHIVIRGNKIHDCGSGIFTMNQGYTQYHLTRDLLIEGNYVYDSGVINNYLNHNLYIQSVGVTVQYNHFGKPKTGMVGCNFKDRSTGTVFRYNWVENGLRILDLVEAQDNDIWVMEKNYEAAGRPQDMHVKMVNGARTYMSQDTVLGLVRANELAYRKTHVYGNILIDDTSLGVAAMNMIHYGHDNVAEDSRAGTLHFFNNTFVSKVDRSVYWTIAFFDLTTSAERVEAVNNIFHVQPATAGSVVSNVQIMRSGNTATVNFGKNWLAPGWAVGGGTVTGAANLIGSAVSPIDLSTMVPVSGSAVIGAAAPTVLPVDQQYVIHARGTARITKDLGAMQQ